MSLVHSGPQEAVIPTAQDAGVSDPDLAGFISDIAASDVTSEDVTRCQLEVLYGRILSKKDRQEISQTLGVLKAILERARA